ncbi:MAG: hydrogenase maturation protease [Anaerolineales bacterium]|nr:hydrogenase maturation protease [Anaerolineales bacterium]
MRTIVVGLGNPILCDDRAGLAAAQILEQLLQDQPDIDVVLDTCGGLRLMELLIGYDRALILDAIVTGAPPGTVHLLPADTVASQRSASAHDVNLTTALTVGRQAGAHLPEDDNIHYIGIEAEDIQTFSEECTPAVALATLEAATLVLKKLGLDPAAVETTAFDPSDYPIRGF